MGLSELLGTSFDCDCGRTHHVPIRELVYERGAVDSLPEILRRRLVGLAARVAVVADARTWDVCGARSQEGLAEGRARREPDHRSGSRPNARADVR